MTQKDISSPCLNCWIHGHNYDEKSCHNCEADVMFRCLKYLIFGHHVADCSDVCLNRGECEQCEDHDKFSINYEAIIDLDLLSSEII